MLSGRGEIMSIVSSPDLRHSLMSAIALASLVTLSGCGMNVLPFEPAASSPVAIRNAGGEIEVAICESVSAQRLWVEERNVEAGNDWKYLVKASGSADIGLGEIFLLGALPTGLDTELAASAALLSGSEYSVVVLPPDGEEGYLNATFVLEPNVMLPTSKWLHPNGELSVEPCTK
jgi:hypothetical protein